MEKGRRDYRGHKTANPRKDNAKMMKKKKKKRVWLERHRI
jgi:hypothetical protein